MDRKIQIALYALVGTAFVLRLVFATFVVGLDTPPKGDEIDYIDLATSLADGDGYQVRGTEPTARRPFLYPATLALLFGVAGPNLAAARVAQVVLGGFIVWLVFLITRRYFGDSAALIATAFTTFNPFLIFISGYLLTENTYIVLLLAMLLFAPRSGDLARSPRRLTALAVVIGLGCLARPTTLGVALWVLAVLWLVAVATVRRKIVVSAVVIAIPLLMLLPWGARNHALLGKWVFLTTHGGVTFYQGNNPRVLDTPQYHGGVAPLAALPGYEQLKTLPTVAKDDAAYALGFAFLRDHKRDVPILVWRKFVRFWRLRSDVGLSGIRSGWWFSKDSMLGELAATLDVGFVYAVVVMPLFVAAMALLRRRFRELAFLYGLVFVHATYPLIFHGSIRMRIPIEPIIAIFAAYAATAVWSRAAKRGQASG